MAVREGGVGDLPGVFAIADEWLGKTQKPYYQGDVTRDRARAGVADGTKRLLIAEEQGRVIGIGVYGMERDAAFITLVMVSPTHLRRGIDSALVQAIVGRHEQVGAFNDVGSTSAVAPP